MHLYLGHLALADSLFERALAMDRELYGAVHPRIAGDLFNLGVVQHDLGRDADAERSYRPALDINQSWYGKEHPDSALMMAAVGQSLIYQGHYDEAAPLLQQALAIQRASPEKCIPRWRLPSTNLESWSCGAGTSPRPKRFHAHGRYQSAGIRPPAPSGRRRAPETRSSVFRRERTTPAPSNRLAKPWRVSLKSCRPRTLTP